MKALEKERISPYISQLYECGINDSDIKLVVDQFRADVSCSSSLFLLRDDDKSDGIKLFSSGLTEAQQQFYVQREFNFEVRHSPMPPDGTLRIP